MAELAPDPAFQKFVRQYWSTLTVGGRADALRVANSDFVGRLREMFARRQAEGPGLFLDVAGGSIVAPRRRGRRPAADEAGARYLYATRWSSPALGGARLVPRARRTRRPTTRGGAPRRSCSVPCGCATARRRSTRSSSPATRSAPPTRCGARCGCCRMGNSAPCRRRRRVRRAPTRARRGSRRRASSASASSSRAASTSASPRR